MPDDETVDELAAWLANEAWVCYVYTPTAVEDHPNTCRCRPCWTREVTKRMRAAVEREIQTRMRDALDGVRPPPT